ncbi:putative bifunctional diguanylate cyclase/phosphodiesterase [Acidovorax sp. NCPPB 3576]|uniref:putative bifunctional diguanylate cyclase/phosphodiesterase n=1 Tax=Acidovorax sp. NCPPB 3576 TaxID=2940488 RepID=UPI00234BD730|nr:sensor domain-containing phosphodiesterase [Acidovorax sp. NCPPB 3576]WCM87793.1 sensor domain-containing phosphodiesterase [Acidovorax sp. NCPPB 3576]
MPPLSSITRPEETDPALEQERQRICALRATGLLETPESDGFDRITRLASALFDAPIALVTLVDIERQWHKSRVGLSARELPRSVAFCHYTIQSTEVMVVEDTLLDERFVRNPLVTGELGVRFYAGAPLVLPGGQALGALCILDQRPRAFDAAQRQQLQDLAALVMNEIALQRTAGRINEITSLYNRAQLVQDLMSLCTQAPGEQRTLVLLDVIRDRDLQQAVRAVGIAPLEAGLRDVTLHLMQALGPGVQLYHASETRFAYLLPESGPEARQQTQEQAVLRVQRHLQEAFRTSRVVLELYLVAGLARFTLDAESSGDVLRRATSALHQADELNRAFVWYAPESDTAHRRAFALLRGLTQGLSDGDFRLVYQPQFEVRQQRFSGVEALIRWRHPLHGNVSPAEFIPQVEQTALIHLLTEWVLHTALAQLAQWNRQGLHLTMAINVSARNLEHPNFITILRNAIALHGVAARQLHIECTENVALTGRATQRVLEEIRAMGLKVSLDDFGIGYCNLSCLRGLPAEMLKLDQSLVMPIVDDMQAWTLLRTIISLGQRLGYQLVAEGVETQEILDMVSEAGCDLVQGYFLAYPMEAQEVAPFFAERTPAAPGKLFTDSAKELHAPAPHRPSVWQPD